VLSKPGSGRYVGREAHGFAYERIPARDAARRLRETPVDRTSGKKVLGSNELNEKIRALQSELEVSQD